MNKLFNWKISLLSITSFGIITFFVNLDSNIILTIFAALKEMIFRLFWGGFTGRFTQSISDKFKGVKAYIIGTLSITILAFIITFVLHYFTFTPNPLKTVGINTGLTFLSEIGTIFLFKQGLMKV
jgi:hypothetical protein